MLTSLCAVVDLLGGQHVHRDAVTWLDEDDTMQETYGYAKQGAYNMVKDLNALLAIVPTTTSAPVIVGHLLREGAVSSARGTGKFRSDAIAAARRAGVATAIRCRPDSAYYNHKVIAAILTAKAEFSITDRIDQAVQTAIADDAWVSMIYPKAI